MEANAKAMRGLMALSGKPMPPELEAPVRAVKAVRAASVKSDTPSEHEEQKNFVKWFHLQYPKVLIYAIPNSAMRSPELAAYLKAEGMFKGMPDLHVPKWNLWIEFKRIKGSVTSEEQYWCAVHLKGLGHHHFFAFGAEDAKLKLMSVPK